MFLRVFFIIPIVQENTRVRIALVIPTGTPIILSKEMIDIPPPLADKSLKSLSI